MFLDPADAIFIHLFGFLGQHGVLQVGSVETHRKPETSAGKKMFKLSKFEITKRAVRVEGRTLVAGSY